jgi:hypothetical protein
MRSSPILGLAFALVLVGAVGLPGMATFSARGILTQLALPAPFDSLVLLGAFAPIVYLGRILVIGLDRKSDAARAAEGALPRLRGLGRGAWTATSVAAVIRAVPGALRENRFVLAAGSAVIVGVIGLAVATGGLGSAGSDGPFAGEPAAFEGTGPLDGGS